MVGELFTQKCELCDFETDSKIKLSKHILHTHKLNMSEYRIKTKYNGNRSNSRFLNPST